MKLFRPFRLDPANQCPWCGERRVPLTPKAFACAVMAYCAMVGAISMARAVSDKELSREILKTVAQRLKNPAL
jgi:hypothetical protein